MLQGGRASAAAPTDVSADGDAVNAWCLRNGARAVVLTAAGALVGGDAANGVDVDVTRLPALVAGTASIGGTKDNGPHWTSSFGVSSAVVSSADMTTAANITDAPTSGQKLVVTDFIVSSDTDMRFDFKEETSGAVVMSVYLAARVPVQITPRGRIKLATADKKLQGQASVAGNVRVCVLYFSET